MTSEKLREEFEEWAFASAWLGIGDVSQTIRDTDGSGYLEIELHTAWLAWQASRAAVVVDLPQVVAFEAGYDSIRDNEYAALPDQFSDFEADEVFPLHRSCEVRKAIEAAGLKVKP